MVTGTSTVTDIVDLVEVTSLLLTLVLDWHSSFSQLADVSVRLVVAMCSELLSAVVEVQCSPVQD